MTAEALFGWLIHKTPSGDTSWRVKFFTREKGLLDCHYRGGRSNKKNAALQAFSPLWLLVNERRHWFFLNGLENKGAPLTLQGPALFAALYINELIFYTATHEEQDQALFLAYEMALEQLQTATQSAAIEITLRRFEKKLLLACGFSHSLEGDSAVFSHINPAAQYQFDPSHGFREATTGLYGQHILAVANDQLSEMEALRAAKTILRQAIDHLLGGRQLQSRILYASHLKMRAKTLPK